MSSVPAKHVLVVDNDLSTRILLERQISPSMGFRVVFADSGQQALQAIRESRPELIILDFYLPDMAGLELVRTIRRDYALDELPILILSTSSDIDLRVQAFEAGANDVLTKPHQKAELLARLRNLYRMTSMTRELEERSKRLSEELYLARHVQKQLLPRSFNFQGLTTNALYRAHDDVGGDFYDAWEENEEVHLVMGDISGHGTSSAMLMAVCKGLLASFAHSPHPLEERLTRMNSILYETMDSGGLDMYVTMVYACVSPTRQYVHLISAGHAPTYIVAKDRTEVITATCPALAILPSIECKGVTRKLLPGNTLLLLTDGLLELRRNGEMFGEGHMLKSLNKESPPGVLICSLVHAALNFSGGVVNDDVAVLAVQRSDSRHAKKTSPQNQEVRGDVGDVVVCGLPPNRDF